MDRLKSSLSCVMVTLSLLGYFALLERQKASLFRSGLPQDQNPYFLIVS